jgi:hypothetical protein
MKSDPVIDEIREVRHAISAEHGHDPRRMLVYYADIQARFRDRIVNYGATLSVGRTRRCTGAADNAIPDDESNTAAR